LGTIDDVHFSKNSFFAETVVLEVNEEDFSCLYDAIDSWKAAYNERISLLPLIRNLVYIISKYAFENESGDPAFLSRPLNIWREGKGYQNEGMRLNL
jgi:hypothetical protein